MYCTKNFRIKRGKLVTSAQEAIQHFFNERGYEPDKVIVHPDTNKRAITAIAVKLAGKTVVVPVVESSVLPGISATYAALGFAERNNPAE